MGGGIGQDAATEVTHLRLNQPSVFSSAPKLFSEHSLQNENKHQIMNVYTKWNCLIPILFGLVKY